MRERKRATTGPYALDDGMGNSGEISERLRAVERGTCGVNHPYTDEGAPFPVSAFAVAG